MLTVRVVLLTLLSPFIDVGKAVNISTAQNTYVVDLGYQLNQGQTVVV